MVAGQITDSGSASGSVLEDTAEKRFTCTFTSNAAQTPNEDQTTVTTLTATASGGGNTCSFALSGGADQADFSLSGAALTFAATPDYYNPADADENNAYIVTITATDSADSATTDQTLTATVQDVTLEITASQTASIAENSADDTAVMTVATTDTPTTCDIAAGNTGSAFQISSTCAITVATTAQLNYEATTSYTLTIAAANDGSESDVETVTITITDTNDQTPVYQAADGDDTFNVAENTATSTVIDNGVITDTDTGNSFTCTLGGADAGDFTCTISGNNAQLKFAAVPNYDSAADADTNNVYIVTVLINDGVADDANGATTLTITVTDLNDQTPVWVTGSTANAAEAQTTVATLSATDTDTADGTLTYSIVTDDPKTGTQFSLTGAALTFASAPDYDATNHCGANGDSNTCTV
ncbi:MAG: cadherin domain-containing protein, partial [Candidatus Thermoplasmatota archaeon]|nr:cadherin domain-containing protein [Candidatus Thermoplasmatota archaeon]